MEDILYWIWLTRLDKVSSIKKLKMLETYKPEQIWNLKEQDLLKLNYLSKENIDQILDENYRSNLDNYKEFMKKNNIELININSKYYPKKLNEIYDKPIALFVKGNKDILNDFSLAIIGCRENTKYGEECAKKITEQIVKNSITTISGLARGIDSIAHKTTLKEGGKTIAVIGSGLDNIYPRENIELAEEIIKNKGVIISEYIVGTKPLKYNFPARNRIISGLSNGVVVIEAKKKSGTMITVDFALEQGKEVFAVPGSILNKNSEGTNELIKNGAKLTRNIEDIIEEFN